MPARPSPRSSLADAAWDPAELIADVDPRNLASLRLLLRHGFVEFGRAGGSWQIGDELCDSMYLRIEF